MKNNTLHSPTKIKSIPSNKPTPHSVAEEISATESVLYSYTYLILFNQTVDRQA